MLLGNAAQFSNRHATPITPPPPLSSAPKSPLPLVTCAVCTILFHLVDRPRLKLPPPLCHAQYGPNKRRPPLQLDAIWKLHISRIDNGSASRHWAVYILQVTDEF